ncbi:MAG: hypothetical protein ABJB47_19225 [Actinomycetota bacterium]
MPDPGTAGKTAAQRGPAAQPAAAAPGPERLGYLRQVAPLLWPEPAVFGTGPDAVPSAARGLAAVSEFLLLPRASDPRLLVPAGRRAAAAAVRGYGEPGSG